jgi:ornithine decarboxylase
MAQASRAIVRAGRLRRRRRRRRRLPVDLPGHGPAGPVANTADAIDRGFAEMMRARHTELWCEPGRALVAEASSILTKVELRKGDALYLNDGSYGSLFDAAHMKWPFPVKMYRSEGRRGDRGRGRLKPFRFYGPTCDSIDHMPGPFWLPDDVQEGDYIEIGMLGAYGVAMSTRFNGFGDAETVQVEDAPMASMYGLAKRSIPTVRTTAEENARKVVRLSRPKGRGQKKRRR